MQIGYDSDPEIALALLVELAHEHPDVLDHPEPVALLVGFGDNGINLELRNWIEDLAHRSSRVRSELGRHIWRNFKAAGIVMPYSSTGSSLASRIE